MFDINPETHRLYLSDLERARAKCGRNKAPFGSDRRPILRYSWSGALLMCVALILITTVSGVLPF